MKIKTFKTELDGAKTQVSNGYLIPVWSALEQPALRPDQVYVTVVGPYGRKGPHLHFKRRGTFCCVLGDVVIAVADVVEKKRRVRVLGEFPEDPATIKEVVEYHADMSTVELFASSNHDPKSCNQVVVVPAGKAAVIYNDEGKDAMVLNLPAPAWSKESPDEWEVVGWVDPSIGERQRRLGL